MKYDGPPLFLSAKSLPIFFPLEWQVKAFEEALQTLQVTWSDQPELYKKVVKENESVRGDLFHRPTPLPVGFSGLIERIYEELFCGDPYLFRLAAHNQIEPEKIEERVSFRKALLTPPPDYLWDCLEWQVLEGSQIAAKLHMGAIPVQLFLVGELIKLYLDEYFHFVMVDDIKLKGAVESIEELRRSRQIMRGPNGEWVMDYTPVVKITYTASGDIIQEVFEDTNLKREADQYDASMCIAIQSARASSDFLQNLHFGSSLTRAEHNLIMKYGDKEEKVPFQLLPKFGNYINGKIMKGGKPKDENEQDRKLKEGSQEAMIGLMKGVRTFDRSKGPATPHLLSSIEFALKDAWKKESTTQIRGEDGKPQRLKREWVERSGGGLNDPSSVDGKENGTRGELMRGPEQNPEEVILEIEGGEIEKVEMIQKDERLMEILDKQENKQPLTAAERKYKERAIKKIKETLGKGAKADAAPAKKGGDSQLLEFG